jgi:FMN-dependent NADH-azoreductase
MANILLIQSSIFGEQSRSLGLARKFLKRHYSGQSAAQRVLTPASMPHLDGETAAAFATPESQRADRQKHLLADSLIAELEKADTVVLAVPMHNFSIPSTLKAWIDHVARAGRTFRYTAQGP